MALPQNNSVPRRGGSKLGLVLSIVALVVAEFASVLSNPKVISSGSATTDKVNNVAGHAIGAILSVPITLLAFSLATVATLLVIVRLVRSRLSGLILNLIVIGLSIWAFSVAVGAFNNIKGH